MGFRTGGEAAQKASETTGGARFARAQYLSIEDDGVATIRYITDEPFWITVDQHAGVPTKAAPADYDTTKQRWPQSMPAVCRHDVGFDGKYADCYICDNKVVTTYGKVAKPTPRTWAIACLREEVVGTQALVDAGQCTPDKIGKRLGYTDVFRDVKRADADGKEIEVRERALVVCNFAPNNYFNALRAAAGIYGGTVCDRDFAVRKTGKGTDVEYTHIAVHHTPEFEPGTEKWTERYLKAVEDQGLDIEALIHDRASDEYYARFFDPTKTPAPRKGAEGAQSSASQSTPEVPPTPADDVDEERLAAMRARVRGGAVPAGVGAGAEID